MTQRAQFITSVSRLMAEDDKIILLLGDISVYAFRHVFDQLPDRCINIGVCEQASVGVAAGLAIGGFYPIFHTIDSFMVRRAYEQIYLDFGVQGMKGLFISVGADNDYAKLGPTHMCAEGMTMMSTVPGMSVVEPETETSVPAYIESAVRNRLLAYIRLKEAK